jgi:hypothetical protein
VHGTTVLRTKPDNELASLFVVSVFFPVLARNLSYHKLQAPVPIMEECARA